MSMEPGTKVVVRQTGEIKEVGEAPLVTLSEMSILNIAHNVAMAEKLVTTLLEREIDYGRTPGTPTDGLWDAGAAKIMAGFNCYVDHQVLFHTDEENLISWCIQANIISRDSQTIVGTGVGAASTRESKHKYRWVANPRELGYGDDEIAKMKRREADGRYRVINPDYGDLVNTLFLMAAKRAEVDGARSMPGVGGALKKLFENKIKSSPQTSERKTNPWTPFWGRVTQLGITPGQAHEYLGVKSMKEFIDAGGTIESAITKLVEKLAQDKTGQGAPPRAARVRPVRTEAEFGTTLDLLRICAEDFKLSSAQVFAELNYPNQRAYDDDVSNNHFKSYLQIKSIHGEQPEERIEEQPDLPF